MLKSLHIENYALIERSDIDFDSGFVAITGETGAGKSIMLGALALLLGERADSRTLFDPGRKCVVEALFETKKESIEPLFESQDVDYGDDGAVIIRREILPTGKSRAFVNDTPVGLAFLKQLGSRLIDIHSQHATLMLGDNIFQTRLLDIMAADSDAFRQYQADYSSYSALKRELERLTAEEQQYRKDYDYNKFLFDELENAGLTDGEQEQLEQESALLAGTEEIKETLSRVMDICDGEDDSMLARLNSCKSMMGKLAHLGDRTDGPFQFQSLYERLDSCLIELRDIVSSIESANEATVFSPNRQEEVDDRLSLIYRLEKKHGVDSVKELLEIERKLGEQLEATDGADAKIHEVMDAVDQAYKQLQVSASLLGKCRKEGALRLEKELSPILEQLGMPDATLKAHVEHGDSYGPMGGDRVSLLFNANRGGEMREVGKVASGGEMSRLMLAIKSLTSRAGLLSTVIFDEIDTGISGDISVRVGDIMKRMATAMPDTPAIQVIAITHLPQIAARASQHYKVYKGESCGRTTSNIRHLDDDERCHELAVMLSSDPPSAAALQTARELMKRGL
ncbi:MAG: DNA repair protein RecN [Bacteroidales bacterium]|nr:DNA repair protein RecN [Bacteroidales bacterium]